MSLGRYLLGFAALGFIVGSLSLSAVLVRARLLPAWRGAPARLAESVIGFALLIAVLELLGAGNQHQEIASRFVNGFNDPRDYFDWFMDPEKASRYLAQVAA